MVSQPDIRAPGSVRVAKSVAAGPSTTHSRSGSHMYSRSKRYNRSHAGGSHHLPQNEFPVFSYSGDIEIVITTPRREHTNRYLLHRHTLTRSSGFFEASTSEEWSRAKRLPVTSSTVSAADEVDKNAETPDGSSETHSGTRSRQDTHSASAGRKRWRFELDWGPDGRETPILVQKPDVEDSQPGSRSLFGDKDHGTTGQLGSNPAFFCSVAQLALDDSGRQRPRPRHYNTHTQTTSQATSQASQIDIIAPAYLKPEHQEVLRDYDNMFRIFYNYPPMLDSVSMANGYGQCKSLLTLADMYDALEVVGMRVDHHLLQFHSRLWKQVAKYPLSYLRLAFMARSPSIFQEAFIHIVGQWPAGERSIRNTLPQSVADLIEQKVEELEEKVERAEMKLYRLDLSLRGGGGERVNPRNSYVEWLALSLFRQWLSENMEPVDPPSPPHSTAGSYAPRLGCVDSTSSSGRDHRSQSGTRTGNSTSLVLLSAGTSSAAPPMPRKSVMTTMPPVAALGRTFRIIAQGGAAYLDHEECKRFLKLTPELYSRDNLRRFEKRIDELKAYARDIVRPLTSSRLELDAGGPGEAGYGNGSGIGYFTCTRLRDDEMPWAYACDEC